MLEHLELLTVDALMPIETHPNPFGFQGVCLRGEQLAADIVLADQVVGSVRTTVHPQRPRSEGHIDGETYVVESVRLRSQTSIHPKLVAALGRASNWDAEPPARYRADLSALGTSVAQAMVETYNVFIDFLRCEVGQWWIARHSTQIDPALLFFLTKARVTPRKGRSFRFAPMRQGLLRVEASPVGAILNKSMMRLLRMRTSESTRPSLVRELVTNARVQRGSGNARAAIIEVVSALEVAIGQFGQSARMAKKWQRHFAAPMKEARLSKNIQELGLRRTVAYLLPLLVSPRRLPHKDILAVTKALEVRNAMIHRGGHRRISLEEASVHIRAVETLCKVLEETALGGSRRDGSFWQPTEEPYLSIPILSDTNYSHGTVVKAGEGSIIIELEQAGGGAIPAGLGAQRGRAQRRRAPVSASVRLAKVTT